jgi:hypothetical protein
MNKPVATAPIQVTDEALLGLVLIKELGRYVVLTQLQAVALALWILHTWAFEAATMTPYIGVLSPTMRAGKSLLFRVLELVTRQPHLASNMTAASIFRTIAYRRPTLFLDEVDASGMSSDLRAILNDGYHAGGKVTRVERVGGAFVPIDFPTFCPKAFAGIGRPLPPTIMDRSIPIRLKRKAPDEHVERFLYRQAHEQTAPLRTALQAFADLHVVTLSSARPSIPAQLNDRAADIWEPLLAIADLLDGGGWWSDSARAAALELSVTDDEEDPGVQMLTDLRAAFAKHGASKAASGDLLAALRRLEDPSFAGDYQGLTPADLARHLRPFEIRPKTIRIGTKTRKGYDSGWFADAWRRYLPAP